MRYCVVILDGAAGMPLGEHDSRTCLELAHTPNLDAMAFNASLGLARTVPEGMEPSSACACMSVLGYDPKRYYKGRATIEAKSMGIPVEPGEVVFRCNLVTVNEGRMQDYSAGHISSEEAAQLIKTLNDKLGSDRIIFYPGISYRHIVKLKGYEETLGANCTPPHDIPGQPVAGYLPQGKGSDVLLGLMKESEAVLREHPVNLNRIARGEVPATTIWLFWGSGQVPEMPPFKKVYGLKAALTSAVDLLSGLAQMADMDFLKIAGVTDKLDNDFAGQAEGALAALDKHDLVVIHIEAPDEAGHAGSVEDKVEALQRIDREVIGKIRSWRRDTLRVLVMPDHPTPIKIQTHSPDPVPFMLWGDGFTANGAKRFTEAEAAKTGLFIDPGYNIMAKLTGKG